LQPQPPLVLVLVLVLVLDLGPVQALERLRVLAPEPPLEAERVADPQQESARTPS
jgi:hypothetical protein